MEILSIGEKIKRARIYKNCTLKELCGEKISISKMSCIENDKIKPEKWIIEFIAKKLDMDEAYLNEGVSEQILNNMTALREKNSNYEEDMLYNIEYANEYMCFDLAFELTHRLFNYYVKNEEVEKIQELIYRYYDICDKSGDDNNQVLYYKDMANYFFISEEYGQAITYYYNLSILLEKQDNFQEELFTYIKFREVACQIALKNYKEAKQISSKFEKNVKKISDDIEKAEMYNMLAIIALESGTDKFKAYEKLVYEHYGNDYDGKANSMYNYSVVMFELGMYEDAVRYIKDGLDIHSQKDKGKYVNYMLLCLGELVKNDILDFAQQVCDEALNDAINLDNVKLIEKAYFYKAIILQKKDNVISAEMYMNLSIDALSKFGTRQQKYERYMEMGKMYHSFGQLNDSLRCFTIALSLEKKM